MVSFLKRPFQFAGTAMHANVLLMCKLLLLLIIAHHFFFKINDPFIPFIPFLDTFNEYPGIFKYVLRAGFVLGSFGLLFNYFVRSSALLVGTIVILGLVASKPLFNNHTFVVGCALLLAGLTDNKQPPILLIYQLSLVYIGASVNKFMDHDWWSGAFMNFWLEEARGNILYIEVASWLPELVFAKILSYIAMFTEFIIGITLLFKKYRTKSIWFIILFHFLLFSLTSFRFGHFIESLAIILIAAIHYPKGYMKVSFTTRKLKGFQQLIRWMDWDKKIIWQTKVPENTSWLELETNLGKVQNDKAMKDTLLFTPGFFAILFALDVIVYLIFYNHRDMLFVVNLVWYWALIIFFLPINWSTILKKN